MEFAVQDVQNIDLRTDFCANQGQDVQNIDLRTDFCTNQEQDVQNIDLRTRNQGFTKFFGYTSSISAHPEAKTVTHPRFLLTRTRKP
jgi:hypothetical protein